MVTRAQVGTVKPNPRFNLHTSHISLLPKSLSAALSDPNWRVAMYDEYNALVKDSTWMLVSKPPNANVLDVKNTFLNDDISETVYMYQPSGFVDSHFTHHVCQLQRSLYGLKHAPRAWFQRFTGYAYKVGFSSSRCGSSLFIYQYGSEVAYLLIYVVDIVLTASSTDLLQCIISSLHKEFDMTDLGALNYFLGISVTRDSIGMFLSQKKYDLELLDRAHMANCNPTRMPVDTESKLGSNGDPISNPTLYRSVGLQYLTFTRPDISYAVQQVCLHIHDPREPHLAALKRVLRYVSGTLDFDRVLKGSLVAYTDVDWAGCPTNKRSTSGYYVFLGDNLLLWLAKRQHSHSRSTAKAEYRGVANVVAETARLRNLLRELHTPLLSATIVYCDNYADIFTKRPPSALFEEFRTSLSVRSPSAQTEGEC
nr:ribonuclease H-like domain-containing protein [Tanacetum cinerariifolium]